MLPAARAATTDAAFSKLLRSSVDLDELEPSLQTYVRLLQLIYDGLQIRPRRIRLTKATFAHTKQRTNLTQIRFLLDSVTQMRLSRCIVLLKVE